MNVLIDEDTWAERRPAILSEATKIRNGHGIGRELFGNMRKNVLSAEEGAITWMI